MCGVALAFFAGNTWISRCIDVYKRQGFVQHRITLLVQRSVIDTARGAFPVDRFIFFRVEEARFGQQVQVNKIRIARKGRKRLVRAVAIAGDVYKRQVRQMLSQKRR